MLATQIFGTMSYGELDNVHSYSREGGTITVNFITTSVCCLM